MDLCEKGYAHEILRIWEPHEYFVVVGYSSKLDSEVNRHYCRTNRIPVLRRCSGGGAVLQGPGCFNYSLILRIQRTSLLGTVSGSNAFIMRRQTEALKHIIGSKIEIQGFSDLSTGGLKVSGNAQYRKKDFLLFHGTFLLHLDLSLVEKVLPLPSRQPPYRQNRSHGEFLTNLDIPADLIKRALQKRWEATERLAKVPLEEIETLVKTRYGRDQWNDKF
jgi:lipoate-protein ligase A